MKEALWNLTDAKGLPWAQERWTWINEIEGYKIEIRYFQGTDTRDFVEASQPNMSKKRVIVNQYS